MDVERLHKLAEEGDFEAAETLARHYDRTENIAGYDRVIETARKHGHGSPLFAYNRPSSRRWQRSMGRAIQNWKEFCKSHLPVTPNILSRELFPVQPMPSSAAKVAYWKGWREGPEHMEGGEPEELEPEITAATIDGTSTRVDVRVGDTQGTVIVCEDWPFDDTDLKRYAQSKSRRKHRANEPWRKRSRKAQFKRDRRGR